MANEVISVLRGWRREPRFPLLAILTLGSGIAVSTAVFSAIDTILIRSLPFPAAERLVRAHVHNRDRGVEKKGPSAGDLRAWQDRGEAFKAITGSYVSSATLLSDQGPVALRVALATPGFFDVFGSEPRIGRVFSAQTTRGITTGGAGTYASGDRLIVVSDAFWRAQLGADPRALARPLMLDGVPWRVLGVMPPGFGVPDDGVDGWIAWDLVASYARHGDRTARDSRFLHVIGRLRDGLSLSEAQARLDAVAQQMAAEYPDTHLGWGVQLDDWQSDLVKPARPLLLLLAGAVLLTLLIACVNVAGLQLARGARRRGELAVRQALGASRSRLARLVLTESALLAVGGAGVGALGAWQLVERTRLLLPPDTPRLAEVAVDLRVLVFSIGLATLAALGSGLAPALQSWCRDLAAALKEQAGRAGARRTARLRQVLVASEVALALVLVSGAGLFATSLSRLIAVDRGFQGEGVLALSLMFEGPAYPAGSKAFYADLIERLEALPGATSAGAVTTLPLQDVGPDFDRPYWRAHPDAGERAPRHAAVRMATPGYFEALGIPLLRGRGLDGHDVVDSPRVLLVNQALARETWPGEDPVGQTLVLDYRGGPYSYEIVGVVGDTRHRGLRAEPSPQLFIPHAQNAYWPMTVVLRSSGPPEALEAPARRVIRELAPSLPVRASVTMDELDRRAQVNDRFALLLLGVLSTVAVILVATGIFGLLSSLAQARRHELGVRLALGARRADVVGLLVGEALRFSSLGAMAGLVLAVGLGPLVRSLLFETGATDPAVLGAGAVGVLAIAALAALSPARRASLEDPLTVLRAD